MKGDRDLLEVIIMSNNRAMMFLGIWGRHFFMVFYTLAYLYKYRSKHISVQIIGSFV